MLTLRANLWLEQDGNVILSPWRLRLLEAIRATGSISAAARQMGVDYRCAWDKLDEMESGLGEALVERQVGGPGGGGATLTPAGDAMIEQFAAFMATFEDAMTREGRQRFGATVEINLSPTGVRGEQAPCETPAPTESDQA